MHEYTKEGIPLTELPWIAEARKWIGQSELPGKPTASFISRWLSDLNAWWADDETPWCGLFVAHCLQTAKLKIPSAWFRAFAYSTHGVRLSLSAYGAVVVLRRSTGAGYHVAFIVGRDSQNRLMCLGGNQGNKVSIAPFSRDRVVAIIWPSAYPQQNRFVLPVLVGGNENTQES